MRIIKYWLKLATDRNSNCILKSVYNDMKTLTENSRNNLLWTSKVKSLLERHGFAEVWQYPESVNMKPFLAVLKTRLIDTFLTEARAGIRNSSSLSLFKELDNNTEIAPYLKLLFNEKYRTALAKIRLSSHLLAIETGRHNGILRENRKCTFCDLNDIEDEYHFIIICPLYRDIRKDYIPNYYVKKPSMDKFITLLKCTSVKRLKNLATFVIKATKLRNLAIINEIV